MTETRDGLPSDVYQYPQNPATGNSPVLSSIALGMGNTRNFTYGAAGHLESISVGSAGTGMTYDEAGRLSTLTNLFDSEDVELSYDGSGYLSGSSSTADTVTPVYSSDGLLHALVRPGKTVAFLYLAGRPVGTVTVDGAGTEIQTYTTDHLGTPMLVADGAGAKVWSGGFEPFGGEDAGGATAAGVELRFPGQVEDESWENLLTSSEIYYNVHRWYLPGVGRYSRPDPAGRYGDGHVYSYANSNPLVWVDPMGLKGKIGVCCTPLLSPLSALRHCFIRRVGDDDGVITMGMHTDQTVGNFLAASFLYAVSEFEVNHPFDLGAPEEDCAFAPDPCDEKAECALDAATNYPSPAYYSITGPNSNSFAGNVARQCSLPTPPPAGTWSTPGWHVSPPARYPGKR